MNQLSKYTGHRFSIRYAMEKISAKFLIDYQMFIFYFQIISSGNKPLKKQNQLKTGRCIVDSLETIVNLMTSTINK